MRGRTLHRIRWCSWEEHPDYCHTPHLYELPAVPARGLPASVCLCPGGDFSALVVWEEWEPAAPCDGTTAPRVRTGWGFIAPAGAPGPVAEGVL